MNLTTVGGAMVEVDPRDLAKQGYRLQGFTVLPSFGYVAVTLSRGDSDRIEFEANDEQLQMLIAHIPVLRVVPLILPTMTMEQAREELARALPANLLRATDDPRFIDPERYQPGQEC